MVVAVARLLAGIVSAVAALTRAMLVIRPPSLGAVTRIVIVELVLGAWLAWVHVTTPPACRQIHPVPAALTKVTPAGSVSRTVSMAAALGPLFVTVSV